jgi:RNA polymerase sigma-70 factor (ECF subfamily)
MDLCQSVLASFFAGATAGRYDLERPDQLVRLLVGIARNKVARQVQRQRAGNRDLRRDVPLAAGGDVAGAGPSPSRVACGRELLAEFRRRLSAEERRLADLRAEGRGWAELAAELGGTAQARRMQLARAVGRVARELGLERPADD